jgi:serine/threonine-protein kinase
MAPEQIEGLDPSPRADIYALGILIYEMITGVRPFHGETSLSSAVKRLKHDAEPPSEYLPDISPIWELAILRCLRREPGERYQTMDEVIEAISGGPTARVPRLDADALRDSKPLVTEKVKPLPAKTRTQRRVLALAGVAIAVALVALVVGPRGKKSASPATTPAGSGSAAVIEPAPTKASATRLVVLPFSDRSPTKDQEFLADGITDELLVLVGKMPAISVIGRTSAFALKNTTDDATTIGRKLGVSRVLTGSVARAGDRVRITVQLIDAKDGTQLWSDSFDKQAADLFALQDEIAAAVARALAVELVPSKPVAGERTSNAEAHTLVLRGRALLAGDYNKVNLEQAGAAFERAVALDPAYAAALASLAVTQYWLRDFAASAADADRLGKRALELADKARSLGPEVAEAHAARGFLAFNMTWDWATARAELQRALELEPTNRETLRMYAMLLSLLGETDRAVSMIEQAVASDPLSARLWAHQGSLQTVVGQHDRARKCIAKALELNPDSSIAHLELATVELLDGHFDQALQVASRISEPVYAQIVTAMAHHSLGNKTKSDEVLADLIKTNRHTAAYQIAEIYAWRGDPDHAFEWLDNAVGDHDAGLADIRIDVLLTSIRTDPRYRALLTKLGL